MKLNPESFNLIKERKKTVEIRLLDEKRKALRIGEQIEFSKRPELTEKVLVEIIDLKKLPDFQSLFEKFTITDFGYPEDFDKKTFLEDLYKIYPPEEEKLFGVIAIKIKSV